MHLRIVLTLKLLNSNKMKDAHSFTPNLSASRFQLTSHKFCENAFYSCQQLTRVELEPNSELKTIGGNAI